MFLTCETYRQATWSPDVSFNGAIASSSSFSNTNQSFSAQIISQTGAASSNTTSWSNTFLSTIGATTVAAFGNTGSTGVFTPICPFATAILYSFRSTISSSMPAGFGSVAGVSSRSSCYISALAVCSVVATSSRTTAAFSYTSSHVSLATSAISSQFWTYLSSTSETSTTTTVYSTLTTGTTFWGANTGSTGSAITSSVTTSTSASASGTTRATSVASTVTATTTATATIVSTATATSTYSIFKTNGTTVKLTSAPTSTNVSTLSTITINANTTSTSSVATPSWWGWSYEVGTLLLATANTGTDDLPCWLEMSNFTNSVAGLWNFSTATQTTLWPFQPVATVGSQGSTQASALGATTTINVFYTTNFSLFGSVTTLIATASAVSVPNFSAPNSSSPFTVPIQLTTTSGGATSWTGLSNTITNSVWTPINTSWVTLNPTTSYWTDQVYTNIKSSTGGHTTVTSYTLTTLVAGYTTVSSAIGISPNALISPGIITLSSISATTTLSADTWVALWSNPIATVSYTIGQNSTTASGGSNSRLTTGFGFVSVTLATTYTSVSGSSTIGGTTADFSSNSFASPYPIGPLVSVLTAAIGNIEYAPASVQSFAAIPSMQGFVNTSNTNVTYQSVSLQSSSNSTSGTATIALTNASVYPLETGQIQSFNSLSGPANTTRTGVWVVASSASTFTASTTLNTTTQTGTTTSQTATTTADTTLTKNSWNGPAATYTNSVTSTFGDSSGFTRQTSDSHTETYLLSYLAVSGTSSSTSYYLATSIGNAAVTWTQNTTAGNPYQYFPGAGGKPKYNAGAVTLAVMNAAISLSGNSTTWSTASPNFMLVAVGANFTTTSSATVDFGAGPFTAWTIPGQVSLVTSPCYWISTKNDRYALPLTSATRFWIPPDPFLLPMQATYPQPARSTA